MPDIHLEYSKERGTWNVFANGEWYYESPNYEQAENVFNSFFWQDNEDEPNGNEEY